MVRFQSDMQSSCVPQASRAAPRARWTGVALIAIVVDRDRTAAEPRRTSSRPPRRRRPGRRDIPIEQTLEAEFVDDRPHQPEPGARLLGGPLVGPTVEPVHDEAAFVRASRPDRRQRRRDNRPCRVRRCCRPGPAPGHPAPASQPRRRSTARSTDAQTSTRSTSWRTLFDCSCPMNCTSGRSCSTVAALADQSCA